jgi:hypothetical protein
LGRQNPFPVRTTRHTDAAPNSDATVRAMVLPTPGKFSTMLARLVHSRLRYYRVGEVK